MTLLEEKGLSKKGLTRQQYESLTIQERLDYYTNYYDPDLNPKYPPAKYTNKENKMFNRRNRVK